MSAFFVITQEAIHKQNRIGYLLCFGTLLVRKKCYQKATNCDAGTGGADLGADLDGRLFAFEVKSSLIHA